MRRQLVIFVHGWSVTNTDTYGELPARLRRDAGQHGLALDVQHIRLGQYVSFRDEVRIEDIAHAFEAALAGLLQGTGGDRGVVCITHSTGGPVLREWLDRYYVRPGRIAACPLRQLVMLAPANFGAALAQLGKRRVGAIRAWFNGVEPGQSVLDWLELASPEACALNLRWIHDYPRNGMDGAAGPIQLFVLSGDAVDRRLYDHVNAYTGETGSDGVVRLAGANLNASHVVLAQPLLQAGEPVRSARRRLRGLEPIASARAPATAFKIVPGVAHSGAAIGIMRSVRDDGSAHPTVQTLLRCLQVRDAGDYARLCDAFAAENARHQAPERRLERERMRVVPDREYVHDPHAMVIFRLLDAHGAHLHDAHGAHVHDAHGAHPHDADGMHLPDVDLLLTAGPEADPDQLPQGFLTDRQGNRRAPGNLAFYLNHAALAGCPPIVRADGSVARAALVPRAPYGLRLEPREAERMVGHWPAQLDPALRDLLGFVHPNETTIVDIYLRRIVRAGVFRFTGQLGARSFKAVQPGTAI